jgi:TonB family protein
MALSLLLSGASHSQDKTKAAGSPRSGFPDVTINAQIPDASAVDLAKPEYPPIPRLHIAAEVSVQIKIDRAGDVIEARSISGHPLLVSSAVEAARKSKFTLKSDPGSPSITGTITYTFTFPKDNDVDLSTLVGQQVTLRGQFSMRGKIGPFIVVSGKNVYLEPRGSFSWGKHYSRMQGKHVSVTGTLRFYKAPPAREHDDSVAAGLPEYFYFEAEHAIVRLEKQRRH